MSKTTKVLIYFWFALIILFGIYFVFSFKKLNPENVVDNIFYQIEKNNPEIKIVRKSPSSSSLFSLNTSFEDISFKFKDHVFLSIANLELKIPWWVVFFQNDTVEINLSEVKIYLDFVSDDQETVFFKNKLKKEVNLELPAKITKLTADLRIKKIAVFDRLNNQELLSIEKFLLKNLNSGNTTPFELVSVSTNSNQKIDKISTNIFGDINFSSNPWEIRYIADFSINHKNEDDQLDKFVLDGTSSLKWQSLKFNSKLNIKINKEAVGNGVIDLKSGHTIAEFKLSNLPLNYLNIFSSLIKNPFLPELVSAGSGVVKYEKKSLVLPGILNANLEFDGAFQYNSKLNSYPGRWRFLLKDSRLETSFVSSKANVTFFRRSYVNLDTFKIEQYFEEVGFSNVDFASSISGLKPISDLIVRNQERYFSSTYVFKDCLQQEKLISGEVKYGNLPEKRYYVASLNAASSSLKMNYEGIDSKNRLQLVTKKFPWTEHLNLLAPIIEKSVFLADGYLDGKWENEVLNGDWQLKMKTKNIVNLKGSWFDFLLKSWSIFQLDISSHPVQNWNLNIKSSKMFIEGLTFEADKKFNLSGVVDLSGGESYLVLKDLVNKKSKLIKKQFDESLIMRSL